MAWTVPRTSGPLRWKALGRAAWPRQLLSAPRRVQIGNNRGGINGWTGFDRVYGIAVSVAGRMHRGLGGPPVAHS